MCFCHKRHKSTARLKLGRRKSPARPTYAIRVCSLATTAAAAADVAVARAALRTGRKTIRIYGGGVLADPRKRFMHRNRFQTPRFHLPHLLL